ncbi:MAG: TetR/AcrR family transcriptional regulator [Chloroflexi bacterium]|nr:TetR/AcrR family transcriptional regulator [Chloroflexota bacterium]
MKAKIKDQKVDRRVLRTRQALRSALLELISEKEFDSISVEEITERANLGRATFYLHFKDKEDLLLEEFRVIASNRVQVLSEIPNSIWILNQDSLELANGSASIMPLLLVFEHAAQNADIYRILLRGENSQRISVKIREIIVQSINEIIQSKQKSEAVQFQMEVPVDLLAAYFSGALMSCLNWWLDHEASPQPEEMARMFQHLFFPGVLKVWNPGKLNTNQDPD